jgi:hypothetical protein
MFKSRVQRSLQSQSGFTLIEVMITSLLLMVVTAVVLQGMLSLTQLSQVMGNRTEMHAGVRNATALLQQEVGQAGRVSFPNGPNGLPVPVTLAEAVAAGASTVTVAPSTAGMFVGQHLVVDTGQSLQETITLTAVDPATDEITAIFASAHPANAPVSVPGGFAAGVIPTQPKMANGSTPSVLKIVGDINGTGDMVYVEYTCDVDAGRLYRNSMRYDAAVKPNVTVKQVLLDNIEPNPDGTPCFTYEEREVETTTYVIGVAITLTVRTQERDPITQQFQTETKALLNVAPRNVFHAWQLASLGFKTRVQPLPASTELLLP